MELRVHMDDVNRETTIEWHSTVSPEPITHDIVTTGLQSMLEYMNRQDATANAPDPGRESTWNLTVVHETPMNYPLRRSHLGL